jgi:hypothetical protein
MSYLNWGESDAMQPRLESQMKELVDKLVQLKTENIQLIELISHGQWDRSMPANNQSRGTSDAD